MDHKVVIEPSGLVMTVQAGESILDAALRNGINLAYGCRNAVCGACKGRLLEGQIDYGGLEPAGLIAEEREQGMALFCRAIPQTDLRIESVHVTSSAVLEIRTLTAIVVKMERLAEDVMRLYLQLADEQRLPFFAGQYVDILLPDGRRRSFSLANPPHDDEFLELHVRFVDNGEFSRHVFQTMKEQEQLVIEGPYGSFYFRENSTRPMIMVAGGTGFAPIKAVIEHAIAEGVSRPIYFYWGARAGRDLYLDKLAEAWVRQLNLQYRPVLSAARPDDNWQGRQGFVHEAILNDFDDLAGYDVYACGPPVMVNAARQTFIARGLPDDRFYADSFEFANDTAIRKT